MSPNINKNTNILLNTDIDMTEQNKEDEELTNIIIQSITDENLIPNNIISILRDKGLSVVNIPRDGNCMFSAVTEHLPGMNHFTLRKAIVWYLKQKHNILIEYLSKTYKQLFQDQDDSFNKNIPLGFDFQYYGQSFNSLTVCSNGWASFLPCLNIDGDYSSCNTIPYFANNSIPHPLGPYGMLAPFFDDLDDNIDSNGGTHEEIPFEVFFWSNDTNAIVQWNKVANGQLDDICIQDDVDSCPRHTS